MLNFFTSFFKKIESLVKRLLKIRTSKSRPSKISRGRGAPKSKKNKHRGQPKKPKRGSLKKSKPRGSRPDENITLGQWVVTYETIISERGYKDQTIRNRKTCLSHVKRLWGQKPLRELKSYEVVASIRREFLPDRSSTAHRVLSELRDVYIEAIANGEAEMSPAMFCKLPIHHVLRQRLSWETFYKMVEVAETHPQKWVKCLLLLAIITGQRRADLAKMRFTDVVDLPNGLGKHLRVEQQKQAGKGYGARVEIPLTLRLDKIGLTVGDVITLCKTCGKPGPTLLRKQGGGPIEVSSLSTRFAEVLKGVLGVNTPAVNVRPTLHEARSLAARLYNDQGIDVQTLLGHKHAEMTEMYLDDRGSSGHEWKRLSV